MDIHELKTFAAVARTGSITKAAQLVHLSQPAVSAHIKSLEDELGVSLFDRTAKGMNLTCDGQRLLEKAELTIAAHQAVLDEASRLTGQLTGTLRLGASSNANQEIVARLVTRLAERHPAVEVALTHSGSAETLAALRDGTLDAGFYHDSADAPRDLTVVPVSQFSIFVVAAPSLGVRTNPVDWSRLSTLPWVYPSKGGCCTQAAERLFKQHGFRPVRVIGVDRPELIATLVATGLGVGLLHADVAQRARAMGEVELLAECERPVQVLFACLRSRAKEPLLAAVAELLAP